MRARQRILTIAATLTVTACGATSKSGAGSTAEGPSVAASTSRVSEAVLHNTCKLEVAAGGAYTINNHEPGFADLKRAWGPDEDVLKLSLSLFTRWIARPEEQRSWATHFPKWTGRNASQLCNEGIDGSHPNPILSRDQFDALIDLVPLNQAAYLRGNVVHFG